jgi:hypothetical protein
MLGSPSTDEDQDLWQKGSDGFDDVSGVGVLRLRLAQKRAKLLSG